MLTYDQKQLIESYYDFVGFAQATGLTAPVVGKAYNEFREFCFELMKEQNSFDMDGIITEAFEVWIRTQTVYPIN